jgi:hypothetical protein
VCDGVRVVGERPSRADQRRAALHAAMGDVLKIVRFGAVVISRGCDGCDGHPVAAMRAGEEETRQVRWRNAVATHGAIPFQDLPIPLRSFPDRFRKESTNICAMHKHCASHHDLGFLVWAGIDPGREPVLDILGRGGGGR